MSYEAWRKRSAEAASSYPDSYLVHYPEMLIDDKVVVVTPADYARIQRLPRYDASVPTGVYEGKMWLCHGILRTYERDPTSPDTYVLTRSREVLVVE